MSHSGRFTISQILVDALRAAQVAGTLPATLEVLDNPDEPTALREGQRLLYVEDIGDALLDKKGQQDARRFSMSLGAICRTDNASRSDVDQLFEAAVDVIEAQFAPLNAVSGLKVARMHLTDVAFTLEGIDAGGALILGTYEIEYTKRRAR